MMVSKEEMVDVLKAAAVSCCFQIFLFVPVCILLLGSPAGLIQCHNGSMSISSVCVLKESLDKINK